MALSRSLRGLTVALALALPAAGCATTAPGAPAFAARADRVSAGGSLESRDAFEVEPAGFELGAGHLERTSHDGARAGFIVAAVFLFPFVIVIDLITLPVAAPCHKGFYCTTAVVHHCCH